MPLAQVFPSLFFTLTASIEDSWSSPGKDYGLPRTRREVDISKQPGLLSGKLASAHFPAVTAVLPEIRWRSSWTSEKRSTAVCMEDGWSDGAVFSWPHLRGNFPGHFLLLVDSLTLTVIILEAPRGIAGAWRVTNSTSLGLCSEIRGRALRLGCQLEVFIHQHGVLVCLLVVSCRLKVADQRCTCIFLTRIRYFRRLEFRMRLSDLLRRVQLCRGERAQPKKPAWLPLMGRKELRSQAVSMVGSAGNAPLQHSPFGGRGEGIKPLASPEGGLDKWIVGGCF